MKLHQQGNEIIATELRPMSEITNAEYVLISIKNELYPGRHLGCGFIRFADQNYYGAHANDCDGWLPIPKYQPDAKHIDKTELYEKLRKLNPREFAELHERNLRGEDSFDDLVSRLP